MLGTPDFRTIVINKYAGKLVRVPKSNNIRIGLERFVGRNQLVQKKLQ